MTLKHSIIGFYNGDQPDHAGRYLSEIQSWEAGRLERVHDFIQWLFPLPEASPVNPAAPVLDQPTIAAFRSRPELQDNLLRSLKVMLAFYGFALTGDQVTPTAGFEAAARNWLSPNNHNHLRITRILRSTYLLGLEAESRAFLDALDSLYSTTRGRSSLTSTTFRFWNDAVPSRRT